MRALLEAPDLMQSWMQYANEPSWEPQSRLDHLINEAETNPLFIESTWPN